LPHRVQCSSIAHNVSNKKIEVGTVEHRSTAPDAFKALGDPVRWSIMQSIAAQPELAGSVLEESLPISRPTISYHIRILTQAGLIEASKRGRNHYYTVRQDVLGSLLDHLHDLVPGLRLVPDTEASPGQLAQGPPVTGEFADSEMLPTW